MGELIKRFTFLFIILFIVFLYNKLGLNYIIDLDFFRKNFQLFEQYYLNNSLKTTVVYFIFYVFITSLSIPGANILTIIGGALFGFIKGLIIVSFASSIGATLAFLLSRYFFREFVSAKFPKYDQIIKEGISKNEVYYLLSLRLIPMFPFYAINAVMGLTSIGVFKYYIVSQLGMLLGTAVYVNAGKSLNEINQIQDIMRFDILITLILMGILPIIVMQFKKKKA